MPRLLALVLLLACVAGCAVAPSRPTPAPAPSLPELRLPPAALPGGLALQQRLTFTRDGRVEAVDALVEVDADAVRVVVHAQGQVALRLAWDGTTLQETRADWLPPTLQSGRVLADLQLVFWPRDAIAAALPVGWTLDEAAGLRTLSFGDEAVADVRQLQDGVAELRHLRDGYVLHIESQVVAP